MATSFFLFNDGNWMKFSVDIEAVKYNKTLLQIDRNFRYQLAAINNNFDSTR